MPRQIPLKRARGGGDDVVEGCAAQYLKGIVIIIALIVVMTFCQMAYEARGFLVRMFFMVAGILLVVFAIQERAKIKPWLASVEEQIEQWAQDEKRFTIVVVFLSILLCLILELISKIVFDKNNNASQMNESEVILKKAIITHQNATVVLQPSKQTLHFPSPAIAAQLATILGLWLLAIGFVRRNQQDALFS